MARSIKWTWIVAVVGALALGGWARADEEEAKPARTGNWFTRLFAREPAKKKDAKKDETPAAPSPAQLRQKAYLEWQRRLEVCDKLKQIAFETGDKDLDRKADALDQRAWDLYVQRTGGHKGNLSPDEQLLDRQLGMEALQSPRGPLAGAAAATLEGRTAARGN